MGCALGRARFSSGEKRLEDSGTFVSDFWCGLVVDFFDLFTTMNPSRSEFGELDASFLAWVNGHSLNRCPCS